jgi:hypothetical protein
MGARTGRSPRGAPADHLRAWVSIRHWWSWTITASRPWLPWVGPPGGIGFESFLEACAWSGLIFPSGRGRPWSTADLSSGLVWCRRGRDAEGGMWGAIRSNSSRDLWWSIVMWGRAPGASAKYRRRIAGHDRCEQRNAHLGPLRPAAPRQPGRPATRQTQEVIGANLGSTFRVGRGRTL